VAALAITLEELLPCRVEYAEQVIRNARSLAAHLADRGFEVPGAAFGYTETHQVWVEPPPGTPPKDWGKRLAASDIRSTTVRLPNSGRPGLRLGVQELTRTGMDTDAMAFVADILAAALLYGRAPDLVSAKVADLVADYQQVRWTAGAAVDVAR
jgi:glycine/serine hydroxymethyltransferase